MRKAIFINNIRFGACRLSLRYLYTINTRFKNYLTADRVNVKRNVTFDIVISLKSKWFEMLSFVVCYQFIYSEFLSILDQNEKLPKLNSD